MVKRDERNRRAVPPTWRRQFNESFQSPDGQFSITKTIAVAAQIAVLFHFGRTFDSLITAPESLLIVLSFLIAPDMVKKYLSMKLGGAAK